MPFYVAPFFTEYFTICCSFGLSLLFFVVSIYLVIADGESTAVVILPGEGKSSFGALMKTTQDVRDFFSKHYPNAFGSEGPSEEIAEEFLERT